MKNIEKHCRYCSFKHVPTLLKLFWCFQIPSTPGWLYTHHLPWKECQHCWVALLRSHTLMHLLRLKKCRFCCAMLCYHGGWWHDQFFHKMVTYWNMSWPCYPFASRPNLQKVNDGDVHRNLLIELSHGRWHLRYPYRYWNSSSKLRSNMPISVLAIWPQIPEDAGCKYRRPWVCTNTEQHCTDFPSVKTCLLA